MKNTTVYLVRHGQTEWNLQTRMQGHKNSPLTKLGENQAKKLHDRIIKENIDLIYVSDSPRAFNTANIIKGNRSIIVNIKPELREIHMGAWEGMTQRDIINKYPKSWDDFWNNPLDYIPTDNGESFEELKNRVIPAIEDIIKLNEGKTILIVTHRITLKVIMAYFKGESISDIAKNHDIEPASFSKISFENGTAKVVLYGDTSHYK